MAYTYSSRADADGDRYSAETFRSTRRCRENNRLDHHHLMDKHRERRRQARWRSSGVGVTFTLSGTLCPLHCEHSTTDPSENLPTPSELATSSSAHYRRSRNDYTPERDTGWRDPPRGSRDICSDGQEGGQISLSLACGLAEPGNGRAPCPTNSRPHQCPAAAPTRLSPRYESGQQDTRESAGSRRPVRVPPHVSTDNQRSATVESTQKNSSASRSGSRDLGTPARPVGSSACQGRSRDLKTSAPYVSRENIGEPLVGDRSWAVSYLPGEEVAPSPSQRGRGVARDAVILDRRGNPGPGGTSAAAAPTFSLRSMRWNAHLQEARIMKHVSDVAYWGWICIATVWYVLVGLLRVGTRTCTHRSSKTTFHIQVPGTSYKERSCPPQHCLFYKVLSNEQAQAERGTRNTTATHRNFGFP